MPITLLPISRRRFLKKTLAAAGAIALAPTITWGHETAPADPNRLFLLSDIHLDANPASVSRGVNMMDHFKLVREQILAQASRPSVMLINGDCAHLHGRPQDYSAVAKALEPLRSAGLGIHLGLGNHDSREHLLAAFGRDSAHPKAIADHRVMKIKFPSADWYVLDSLKQTAKIPGILGPEQLKWLASSLDSAADRPAIVMLHHQPDSRPPEKVSGLLDTKAFLDIVEPRKQVKAILFGHTHVWNHFEREGLHFINLPTTAYVFHPEQPAGWVDARLDAKSIKLKLNHITPNGTKIPGALDLKWR